MKSPWVEVILVLLLIGLGALLYLPVWWMGQKDRGHRLKIFLTRKVLWPVVICSAILEPHTGEELFWMFFGALVITAIDQFAKWADRNVPDDHPDKYY